MRLWTQRFPTAPPCCILHSRVSWGFAPLISARSAWTWWVDASCGSSHATPSCLSRTVGSGAQGCSGGSATGTAASVSTGPKALPPGVVPWGSGPGQPTFSVTRRCVSRRNASPPRLHAASCFAGSHAGLHRSFEQGLPGPGGSTRHEARVTRHLPACNIEVVARRMWRVKSGSSI